MGAKTAARPSFARRSPLGRSSAGAGPVPASGGAMASLRRQELGFVVRGPILPHAEENAYPATGQSPQGRMVAVAVAPGPIGIVIGAGPAAATQGGLGRIDCRPTPH